MVHAVITYLGLVSVSVAGITTVGRSIPQSIRMFRMRTDAGVSQLTWGIAIASGLSWVIWGFAHSNLPEILVNSIALIALAVSVAAFLRAGAHPFPMLLVNFIGIIFDVLLNHVSPGLYSSWTVLLTIAFFYPQAWEALSTNSLDGVSLQSWYVSTLMTTCWFIYGLTIGSIPIAAPSVLSYPAIIVILVRLHRYKHEGHRAPSELLSSDALQTNAPKPS